ncbi:hypothetical protein [Secundilactobacillus malefermentans]|uniref:Uncharacterized protein n=1 Tax=Secundilactobacillus malefermentans TaxID=176292 RepID=A0A4R5NFL6_9LACO|nr:hypothetical protein [Secundilactobacillus malefermentans]KRM57951.1 hypothetical protein FD44_GL000879 [Secundilactobacillus malefermentans DSM 5705 = KCTC 3548]QEA31676.1 hypothetical protein FGL90_05485 [Secundilactobacillus malefermentans]TDG72409.1 hypothetical protein C5L31_001108 [Secundilactobacillus malefermentans]
MKKITLLVLSMILTLSLVAVPVQAKAYKATPKSTRGTWYSLTGKYQGQKAGEVIKISTHKLSWHPVPTGTAPKAINRIHYTKAKNWNRQKITDKSFDKGYYFYFRHAALKVNGKKRSVLLWNVSKAKIKSAYVSIKSKQIISTKYQLVKVNSNGSYHY